MKKFTLKVVSQILSVCLLSTQTFALSFKNQGPAPQVLDESVFSFDENALLAELSDLNALDEFVEANPDVTYDDLIGQGNELVANIDSNASPMGMADGNDGPPLGVPSFLWGCVFGLIGLLIVYVATDNDKTEARKAMWGCLASTIISSVLYIALFATLETTTY